MATVVTGSGIVKVAWDWADTLTLGDTENVHELIKTFSFTNGTGSGQINRIYAKQITIPISTTTGLALEAAGFSDFNGTTIDMSSVKLIYVGLVSGSATGLLVYMNSAAFADGWTTANNEGVVVHVGGCNLWMKPTTGFTLASGDELRLENPSGATACVANVIVMGVKV